MILLSIYFFNLNDSKVCTSEIKVKSNIKFPSSYKQAVLSNSQILTVYA